MFRTKHFTLVSNSAKHFPQFICREKYIFDNTKSDASTDFIRINLFHDISIIANVQITSSCIY